LDEKTIRQLAHPGDEIAIDIAHPQMVPDKAHAGRIDESRGDQLELTVLRDSVDLAVALERLRLRNRTLDIAGVVNKNLAAICSETGGCDVIWS
jgi:hypothetical protein